MLQIPEFIPVQRIRDARGAITVFDLELDIPFVPMRVFTITGVPVGVERGGHGHKKCQQYLIALGGSWQLTLSSSHVQKTMILSEESEGILIPVNTHLTMSPLQLDSVLCVFASEKYDSEDYFYDIPELLR
jgi:hypothetical protein